MPHAARWAVATGNRDTTRAAVEVLRAGGNAVDAALAAGFASTVSEPALASLGGGGFLLARAPGEEPVLLDFFVDAPGRDRSAAQLQPHFTPIALDYLGVEQVFHAGWGSVAVPGALAGFLESHRRLGRLPLADVLAPAGRLAREGVALDETQAAFLALIEGISELSTEGRALYTRGGDRLRAGDVVRNEGLAAFLDDVGAGRVTGFDDAGLAAALEKAMDDGGGLVTATDLRAYRVLRRTPVEVSYRGARVLTNPAPSFGGTLVASALRELGSAGALDGSAASYRRLGAAVVRISEDHPTPPASVRGTTHVSVVDAEGGVASMTTSNGSCSGMFVPGTGVHLNNVMGEADLHPDGFHAAVPGTRVGSMMSPMLVETARGDTLVLGSGGSERIRSAMLRVLVGLIDGGSSPADAVEAPRLHWDRQELQVEPGLPDDALEALRSAVPVRAWSAPHLYFGGVHVAARLADGTVAAVGDPRRGGSAEVGP